MILSDCILTLLIYINNSSALTSSIHSPLSVSTASNGSGSSYINSGSSDEESDNENDGSGQVRII